MIVIETILVGILCCILIYFVIINAFVTIKQLCTSRISNFIMQDNRGILNTIIIMFKACFALVSL